MRSWQTAFAIVFVCTPTVLSQERPRRNLPSDAIIDRYLAQEATKLEDRYLDGAQTREEWDQRRPKLKQQYLDMLGLWLLPERTPLKAVVTGVIQNEHARVEKVHFQSRPGLYVTGNLYLPRKIEGKLPAVLYVCGHSRRGGANGCKTVPFFQHHVSCEFVSLGTDHDCRPRRAAAAPDYQFE